MGEADSEEGPTIVTIHGQTFRDKSRKHGIELQPALSAAIVKSFGSVKAFKEKFVETAIGHFASGWVWLMVDPADGSVSIMESHDGGVANGGFTKPTLASTIEDAVAGVSADADIAAIKSKYPAESSVDGRIPLAVLDVWEHAYYLDYQSKRKDYVEAWFKAVDWSLVALRLDATDFEIPKGRVSPDGDYTYSAFY
eukprot:GDKK01031439.1.p1 GENE.GDKK01031439.1~~GDKK01031439.1.p1  ORF type:complete len:196 (+),score=24.45 GDKK01031439.1:1-588(+)